jgi:putative ABC transport system permease protein
MPFAFLGKIRTIPGVKDSMIWQWFGGTYRDARAARNFFARFAVEPDRFVRILEDVQLRSDQKLEFERTRSSCIVGRKLAERFQWRPGDRLTIVGDIFPVTLELTLAGIYTDSDSDAEQNLYFNYEYLHQLLKAAGQASRAESVGVFLTQGELAEDVDAIATSIDKQFEDSPAPTKTESERPIVRRRHS